MFKAINFLAKQKMSEIENNEIEADVLKQIYIFIKKNKLNMT